MLGFIILLIKPVDIWIYVNELEVEQKLNDIFIVNPINIDDQKQKPQSLWYPDDKFKFGPLDSLIIGNPLKAPHCRNALLNKENIDIIDELITHLPKIYNTKPSDPIIAKMIKFLTNRTIPQFWGREQLNALKHDKEWWSGARAMISFDPYWYFHVTLDHGKGYYRQQLAQQLKKVEAVGDGPGKERSPFPMETINFRQEQSGIVHIAEYNRSEPIRFEGLNNSYKSHMAMQQIAYYHIPKCGSTSMKKMLEVIGATRIQWRQSLFNGYAKQYMIHKKIKCGFTFVRHPIHRFISAYYTFNQMLHYDLNSNNRDDKARNKTRDILKENTKFWEIADYCNVTYSNYSCLHRMHVFVDELVNDSWQWINGYHNVLSTRIMEHVGSISGQFMSLYDEWQIDYVGRVEYYEQHWKELSQNISECSNGALGLYWSTPRRRRRRMKEKRKRRLKSNLIYMMNKSGQNNKKTLGRPLVDAYYALALDKDLYDKIVDYYYQDFVCFGYNMTHQDFMEYILEMDPEFDPTEFKVHETSNVYTEERINVTQMVNNTQ